MDVARFGLRQRPFPASPDLDFYYPATTHEQALHRARQGFADGEGVQLLTGGPGTGKTLLCHSLLERLGDAPTAYVTNTHFADRASLLQGVLHECGQAYAGRPEQELRLALSEHLAETFAARGPTVLVVDEAQHLSPDLLEELRMLGNLEAKGRKALLVLLVGQPAVAERLRHPALAALAQRVVVRLGLEPLGADEAADFLLHQLRVAGGRPEALLTGEALELLARSTGGVPRLLNQAALRALELSAENEAGEVEVEAVLEALGQLGLADGDGAEYASRLYAVPSGLPA